MSSCPHPALHSSSLPLLHLQLNLLVLAVIPGLQLHHQPPEWPSLRCRPPTLLVALQSNTGHLFCLPVTLLSNFAHLSCPLVALRIDIDLRSHILVALQICYILRPSTQATCLRPHAPPLVCPQDTCP
eukprot:superscaffoldBa00001348_g10175